MRDYKGWTAAQRTASLKKTKAAIAAGIIPPPTVCNRCGRTTGRIDYHNHDYSDPVRFLEPLCQGCHIRLHRMENKAAESAGGAAAQEPACIVAPVDRENSPSRRNDGMDIRAEMHAIRVAFTRALGLDWTENPNPSSGYKYEFDLEQRQRYLDEARSLRDRYASLVEQTGTGRPVLNKMDSNLANKDHRAVWK